MRAVEYWIDKRKKYLSSEKGTIYKVDLDLLLAICFPNSYYVGMSNLGFHTAYHYLNLRENVKCERVFFENGFKTFALESGRELREFSAIGFSVAFELDFLNIIKILETSGISANRSERSEYEPLVFLGGFVTFFNYAPIIPFVDFIIVGEAEEVFDDIIMLLLEYQRSKWPKDKLLKKLANIDGIYVPEYPHVAHKLTVSNIDKFETISRIVTPYSEFADMFLVELGRGCFNKCKFCLSGNIRETRFRELSSVIQSIKKGLEFTNKVGLIASTPSDYPEIKELCAFLIKNNIKFSFSSLRVTSLNENIMKALIQVGALSLTIAPETGSEDLRFSIGKNIKDIDFFETVNLARKLGFRRIKLYIMIGLPNETNEDMQNTVKFLKKISKNIFTTVSLSVFVPKPMTPFAQYVIISKKEAKEKIKFLNSNLKTNKNLSLHYDGFRQTYLQAKLAKGDEETLLDYWMKIRK